VLAPPSDLVRTASLLLALALVAAAAPGSAGVALRHSAADRAEYDDALAHWNRVSSSRSPAVRRGRSEAAERLGFHYLEGRGVDLDLEEAGSWFRRADSAAGLTGIGDAYLKGLGVDRDLEAAARWYREAGSEQGLRRCAAAFLARGRGDDVLTAIKIHREIGQVPDLAALGSILRERPGIATSWPDLENELDDDFPGLAAYRAGDFAAARSAWEGVLRARVRRHQGRRSDDQDWAHVLLGQLHEEGQGVTANPALAIEHYQHAHHEPGVRARMAGLWASEDPRVRDARRAADALKDNDRASTIEYVKLVEASLLDRHAEERERLLRWALDDEQHPWSRYLISVYAERLPIPERAELARATDLPVSDYGWFETAEIARLQLEQEEATHGARSRGRPWLTPLASAPEAQTPEPAPTPPPRPATAAPETSPQVAAARAARSAVPGGARRQAILAPRSIRTREPRIQLLAGTTSPETVRSVWVDGRRTELRDDGSFRIELDVPVGESEVAVEVIDRIHGGVLHRIAVYREAPAIAAPEAVPDLPYGRYWALVIGNDAYTELPRLRTAVNDADAISGLLRDSYDFEVVDLRNASRFDVMSALARLRKELGPEDNLLVYYAGHGWYDADANQGYWLPVNADASNPARWISNNDVTSMLRAMEAKHVMVVADSCYSGALTRGVKPVIRTRSYLQQMLERRTRVVLSSGGLEPVEDGFDSAHSVFARSLLDALRRNRGVIDGATLFADVRRPVVLNANQTPEYGDIRFANHQGGDFIFVRRR